MCGIAGLIDVAGRMGSQELRDRALAMSAAIRYRGPDAGDEWADVACGVALAHRRLSIIDLSPTGAQPMVSHSGRYVIVFNGEIYNYRALRATLPPVVWRGHSDTEVMLEAVEALGLSEALRCAVDMYAFAVWDTHERALFLVRDRLGEKPLYYGITGHKLVFGSELKAITACPGWQAEFDRDALETTHATG